MTATEQLLGASQHGDIEVDRAALAGGADPEATERGFSSLHWATQEGHLDIPKLLVDHGVRVDTPNDGGFTPLHQAVGAGRTDIVKFLIDNGADVDAPCPSNSNGTPLHTACAYGRTESVVLLLANGADIKARDDEGRAPIDFARMYGHEHIVSMLEERSAGQDTQGTR